MSRIVRTLLPILALAAAGGCGRRSGGGGRPVEALFRDATEERGVDFLHTVQPTGGHALPEIMGSGVAVLDANGDGREDLYFLDAGRWPDGGAPNRLFIQRPGGRFEDRTEASGLGDRGYGTGVAAGDLDNDGDVDLYVGNLGADAVYLNDGRGRFTARRAEAGIVEADWTTSVALLDYDVDGRLDVFVVHYVVYDPDVTCTSTAGRDDYCSPKAYRPVADTLLRNLGGGRFRDVSREAGIAARAAAGLGALVLDFDDDGWPDVYVANDGEPNHVWLNRRNGRFEEVGLETGAAVNGMGAAQASMGVTAGDVDGDGREDLFMTHLDGEHDTLYRRDGGRGFADASMASGLGRASLPHTGFGTRLVDVDHDGDLDLPVVRGHVSQRNPAAPSPWARYAEPDALFLNDGAGRFAPAPFPAADEVTRGLAVADLDGDLDLDLVTTSCAGRARLWENVARKRGRAVMLRVRDEALRRDALGARVIVHTASRRHLGRVDPGGSYLSSSTPLVHVGLAEGEVVRRVEVIWPGGARETFDGVAAGRLTTLTRGSGR